MTFGLKFVSASNDFIRIVLLNHGVMAMLFVTALSQEQTYTMRIEGCRWQEYTISRLEVCIFVMLMFPPLFQTGDNRVTAVGLGGPGCDVPLVVCALCE